MMNGNLFLYRPGGIAGGNVFTDWASLMKAIGSQEGRKILEFDDSEGLCAIPNGKWDMKDVMWAGYGPRTGATSYVVGTIGAGLKVGDLPAVPRTFVMIESGTQFSNLRMIGGQLTIVNKATAPDPSPVSDFFDGENHVHIGMRDDCGNSQFVNAGNVPMFDVGPNLVIFWVQNCLLGMDVPGVFALGQLPYKGILSKYPLIRQSAGSHLALNLLGQNQTGPNLVLSEKGAEVTFIALSSAAQIAVDQSVTLNSGGTTRFEAQGRIQRSVLPLPPLPPTKVSLPTKTIPFDKPNVLIRCDGNGTSGTGFTQNLPAIVGGFTIGQTSIPLYSGGQEVAIAEVMGGTGLEVSPAAGDTIDGSTAAKSIGKFGSRTLISDGVSNWITISKV